MHYTYFKILLFCYVSHYIKKTKTTTIKKTKTTTKKEKTKTHTPTTTLKGRRSKVDKRPPTLKG